MPRIAYIDRKFSAGSLALICVANDIIDEYVAQGFSLTLRQLYYQFVARDIIPNKQREYKRLGSVINDARLAGHIDWDALEDRTRNLRALSRWETPEDIIKSAASSFRLDKWEGQDYRPEVWIEKDALVGVIAGVCEELDVPFFSCRGYTSQSELWGAAMRAQSYADEGQQPYIIHLGDHDPSGIDTSRDIFERFAMFMGGVGFKRIALNMDQVDEFSPPPNPAKLTDSRCAGYVAKYGGESWELDAMEPAYLAALIKTTVEGLRDEDLYKKTCKRQEEQRKELSAAASHWDHIVKKIL